MLSFACGKHRCTSTVGLVLDTQEQNLTIGKGCEFTVNAIHEIFHALGRYHEHNRPDRDEYIHVNWDNILPGQFLKPNEPVSYN